MTHAIPHSVHALYITETEKTGFLVPVTFFDALVWLSG